ncbi:MAG: polyamine aminopropyltransferase [Alphaproteobacteria bacterium]|nr:polyamine aminopropyltransferase [Alphaproteobacteria bacterium]
MTEWAFFDEALRAGVQIGLEYKCKIYEEKDALQHLVVYETVRFGRALVLDGVIQITEKDEFAYSEMMAHVPILAHGAARSVIVIGGGDGGVLNEVLQHKTVERATMIEIDPHVIDICKEWLPMISDGAFEDPRTNLLIADGAKFIAETDQKADVIIVDSTDPHGPGEVLFHEEFYRNSRRVLNPGGILVTQSGVPAIQPAEATTTFRRLGKVFQDAWVYVAAVPTYAGGLMALGWGCDDPSKRATPLATIEQRYQASGIKTRYYHPQIHQAAFAVPGYVRELLVKD